MMVEEGKTDHGEASVIATDLIAYLPRAFQQQE